MAVEQPVRPAAADAPVELGLKAGGGGLQRDLTWEDVSANMTSRVSFWGTYVEIDLTEWGGGTVAVYGVTSPDRNASVLR